MIKYLPIKLVINLTLDNFKFIYNRFYTDGSELFD